MKDSFERRYKREPVIRKDERIIEDIQKVKTNLINLIKNNPNRPATMAYYDEIILGDKRENELKNLKNKVIGTFCYFVPEELIWGVGCIPVRLCSGFFETITPAEEVLPRDICPLIRSTFGCKVEGVGYFNLCSLIVLPTTCDGKKKLGEYISDYLPVLTLNLPNIKTYDMAKEMWNKEIKVLKSKLEEFSGTKITRKNLEYWIKLFQKRSKLFRSIYELRKTNPGIISHRDFLMMVQSSFYDDINRWIEKTQVLYDELVEKSKQKNSFNGEKLLITGAPIIFPNFKILNVIEDLGALVVVDELCSGTQRLWDYAEPDEWTMEGMLESIATRYLLPSTCPCFTTSYDRIDKLLTMVDEFKVDGVIYHDLRLCQLFDMERNLVTKILKDKNIPVLTIHTEYSQEDTEQIKTRIEAFLEMIRSKA